MKTSDRTMRRALANAKRDAKPVTGPARPPDRAAADRVRDLALAITAACLARETEAAEAPPPPAAAPRERRAPGPTIDFHVVPGHQHDIDGRLRNWATWCNGTPVASSAPMFRMAQSAARSRAESPLSVSGVDRADAVRIALAVTALPEKHAAALNWCYVKPVSPRKACETIGVSMEGLAALVTEGRQILINRGF